MAFASGSEPAREALARLKPDVSSEDMTAAEQQLHRLRGGQDR
jgi:hypothetical protein